MKKAESDEKTIPVDTWENYVLKRIDVAKKKLEQLDIKKSCDMPSFYNLSGQIDVLYIVLTGHNNPIENPLIEKELPIIKKGAE